MSVTVPVTPDSRRRRLLLGGFLMASPLALVACGGGDDAGASAGGTGGGDDPDLAAVRAVGQRLPAVSRTTQAVRVALPSGAGVSATQTTVSSANSVAGVGGDGSSSIVLIGGAPQMGYVIDASGRLLLLGVMEAGKRTTLDSRSTAEALLLIASEAAMQGDAMELAVRRVLSQASADAVVEPVRLAVESAAARKGLDADDTALMAALGASVKTMRARASTAPTPMSMRQARPLAVSARPAEPQSGVSVEEGEDFNTVRLKNSFRRRAHAWVDQIAYIGVDGGRVELPTPVKAVTDFDLSPTMALSFDSFVTAVGDYIAELSESIGFLGEYEAGTAFFAPVSSDPIALPVQPEKDAKIAIYRTRVVGVGNNVGLTRTDQESQVLERLWGETFRLDIAVPFLKTFILPLLSEAAGAAGGPGGLKATEELLLAAIVDFDSIGASSSLFPATVAALKAGDADAMLTAFWTEFSTSNTWLKLLEIGMRGTVAASAGPNAVVAASEVQTLTQALSKLARVVAVLRAAATLGDYGAMLKDWAVAAQLSSAEIFVSKAKVSISPKPLTAIAFAGAAGKATVTAQVDDLDGSFAPENIFLKWTCTGKYGHLYKLGFDDVDTFESTLASPSHAYIPGDVEPNPDAPDVITVTAFYRNPTTAAVAAMGSATATVEFKQKFNITLSAPTGDMAADSTATLTALIHETLPSGATVDWTWSHGGVGSVGNTPPDGNLQDSAVVFSAGSTEGSASVTVRAVVNVPATAMSPSATYKLTPKTATLRVKKGLRTVTVTGSWTTDVFTFDNGAGGTGYSVIAFAVVPKVEGFASCSVEIKSSDPYIPKQRSFSSNVFVGRDTDHGEQDRGGAIWLGLSGYSGTIGPDGSGPGGAQSYYASRFGDLTLTATYTLKN